MASRTTRLSGSPASRSDPRRGLLQNCGLLQPVADAAMAMQNACFATLGGGDVGSCCVVGAAVWLCTPESAHVAYARFLSERFQTRSAQQSVRHGRCIPSTTTATCCRGTMMPTLSAKEMSSRLATRWWMNKATMTTI
eukprot:2086162-Rhodomonas_salina.1